MYQTHSIFASDFRIRTKSEGKSYNKKKKSVQSKGKKYMKQIINTNAFINDKELKDAVD